MVVALKIREKCLPGSVDKPKGSPNLTLEWCLCHINTCNSQKSDITLLLEWQEGKLAWQSVWQWQATRFTPKRHACSFGSPRCPCSLIQSRGEYISYKGISLGTLDLHSLSLFCVSHVLVPYQGSISCGLHWGVYNIQLFICVWYNLLCTLSHFSFHMLKK